MCGDGASKELGGIPSSHRRRNSGKYNSCVLGHQATWKIFVVDLVTGYGSATLLFLLAPWLAPNSNTVIEVWHRVKVWMAEQGYPAGSTLYRQTDGGSDMWSAAAIAYAAAELAAKGGWKRLEMDRLQSGHSHNPTDGSISVVSRALNGDRHGTSGGQWTLTATALLRVLLLIKYIGRAMDVMFVHNAHDWEPTVAAAPRAKDLAGFMSVHKLRFDLTNVSGEVGLTVFKHLSSDMLDSQPIVGRDGCHIKSLQLVPGGAAGAGVASGRSRASRGPPLPTRFAPHDEAGLSKARDGYATVATILKNPPGFGCTVPRWWVGTVEAYWEKMRAELETEKAWIPKNRRSPAPEPGVSAVVATLFPKPTGPVRSTPAHNHGLDDALAPPAALDAPHNRFVSFGELPTPLDEAPYDHDAESCMCFVRYLLDDVAAAAGDDADDDDDGGGGGGGGGGGDDTVWVVTVTAVKSDTADGPEDHMLRRYNWYKPPVGDRCRCVLAHGGDAAWLGEPELLMLSANVPGYTKQYAGLKKVRKPAAALNLTVDSAKAFRRLQQLHDGRVAHMECADRLAVEPQGQTPRLPVGYRSAGTDAPPATDVVDSDSDAPSDTPELLDSDSDSEINLLQAVPMPHSSAAEPSMTVEDVAAAVLHCDSVTIEANVGRGFCWYAATAPGNTCSDLVALSRHIGRLLQAAVDVANTSDGTVPQIDTDCLARVTGASSSVMNLVTTHVVGCLDPAFRGGGLAQGDGQRLEVAAGWSNQQKESYLEAATVTTAHWGGRALDRLIPLAYGGNGGSRPRLVTIAIDASRKVRYVSIAGCNKIRQKMNPTAGALANLITECGGVGLDLCRDVVLLHHGVHYERLTK